jgi:hypothetical protein
VYLLTLVARCVQDGVLLSPTTQATLRDMRLTTSADSIERRCIDDVLAGQMQSDTMLVFAAARPGDEADTMDSPIVASPL